MLENKQKNTNDFKIENFEGPLDLLLKLIKNKKISINEFSLLEIADQFVEMVNNSKNFQLNTYSEYLLISISLLEIKTKYLVNLEKGKKFLKENKEANDLITRLLEYEKYKKISEKLFKFHKENPILEKDTNDLNDFVINNVEKNFKLVSNGKLDLINSLNRIDKNKILNKRVITKMKIKRTSIEEIKKNLLCKIKKFNKINFLELFNEGDDKYIISITLICLLEFSNSGILKLIQKKDLEEILIERIK